MWFVGAEEAVKTLVSDNWGKKKQETKLSSYKSID